MQREREAEGDLYQDKESFVTQAYKNQMEEVRRAEEEERKRDGMCLILPISNRYEFYLARIA
jgi:hypothetical protein